MTAVDEASASPHGGAPPALAVLQMLTGRWVAAAVCAVARFQLADHLAARPRSAQELAPLVGAHASTLHRLLRASASLGLFAEDGDGRFAVTPLGEQLRSDVPGTMYGMARLVGTEEHGAAWNALAYAVASGEPAFEHVFGRTAWEYFDDDAEMTAIFAGAMTSLMSAFRADVVEHLDLRGVRTITDVGGSAGVLVAALLERHPALRASVLDRPSVIARVAARASGVLLERCDFVPGDFFESVPPADVIVLSRVLHDWSDAEAARILAACRAALPPAGRIAIVESVIAPGDEPDFGKLLDLEMLVMTTGRERTRAEFDALLGAAGLRMTAVTATRTGAIVEAVRA